MTTTETPLETTTLSIEEFEEMLGDEHLHIKCCRIDRFYYGRVFHPEVEATEQDSEDECCPTCVEIRYGALCPALFPTHQHCPIPLLGGFVCPDDRA